MAMILEEDRRRSARLLFFQIYFNLLSTSHNSWPSVLAHSATQLLLGMLIVERRTR